MDHKSFLKVKHEPMEESKITELDKLLRTQSSAVEEDIPSSEDIKLDLEGRVFGGYLPKSFRTLKPEREGVSDRKGRGGGNELKNRRLKENLILKAVDKALCGGNGEDESNPEFCKLNILSPIKVGRKRKKIVDINFDDLSDEEDADYIGYVKKSDRPTDIRQSNRLLKKSAKLVSGEYYTEESFTENNPAQANEKTVKPLDTCLSLDKTDSPPMKELRLISNVNENYLKNYQKNLKVSSNTVHSRSKIQSVKNSNQPKVQRKRASKVEETIYCGFGEKLVPHDVQDVMHPRPEFSENNKSMLLLDDLFKELDSCSSVSGQIIEVNVPVIKSTEEFEERFPMYDLEYL